MWGMHTSEALTALERDLREIFGTRLRSIVGYGLPADEAHDHGHAAHGHERPAAHTLAIVDAITADDLRACAARVDRWHATGVATPLVLAAHEFEQSLDAFPYEFGAIIADHVLLAGPNPFEKLRIDVNDVRRACEVQARSHLLHLREGFMETRGRADALAVLIVRSAAPFAALLRSVARLQGQGTRDLAAVGRHAERVLNLPGGAVSEVLALAHVKEISSDAATRIFPAYLDAVERLVAFVDGWTAA